MSGRPTTARDRQIDELVEQLVNQFESPYDFLRELVQNAMDAGSDRVEVGFEAHPDDEGVVYELSVMDTGVGMDEPTLDGQLTRLFATGKKGDRTMAGGFGIGFVSVFAWEPDAVLVQTGRDGVAWELLFDAERKFEKRKVDLPFEGTTVTLFRRGQAGERDRMVDAIRETLWKWCRYCPLEITFEELDGDEGPELIQDAPEPVDAAVAVAASSGETTLKAAFAVPPRAVLLRRGLILAEGDPARLLGRAGEKLGGSARHLQIWADSPLLHTTLSRDGVVDDAGFAEAGRRLVSLVGDLRREALRRLSEVASSPTEWNARLHDEYAMLHGHLGFEHEKLGRGFLQTPVVRLRGRAMPVSLESLRESLNAHRSRWRLDEVHAPVLVASSFAETPEVAGLLDEVRWPIVEGIVGVDDPWFSDLLGRVGLWPRSAAHHVVRVHPDDQARGMGALVGRMLGAAGLPVGTVRCARFERPRLDVMHPCFGVQPPGVKAASALYGDGCVVAGMCERAAIWLDLDHALVQAATRTFSEAPSVAALTLAGSLLSALGAGAPKTTDLADALHEVGPEARPS